MLYNEDCLKVMKEMTTDSINLTLTDIPYDFCSKKDNGLRTIDKGKADTLKFNLKEFLKEVYRITKGTIIKYIGCEIDKEFFEIGKNRLNN